MSAMKPKTEREPVIIMSEGQKVFGVIHRPSGSASATGTQPAMLILHGLLGSKDQPHRMPVELAEALAQAGIIALRIDLRGRGDSEGESVDMTWQGDLADVQVALNWLAGADGVDPARIGVQGISWGGILAPVIAGRDHRVKATVIWSAVPTETLPWHPELKLIDGREVAENFAMLVGRQFYDTLPDFHPLEEAKQAHSPMLLIYGSDDDSVPPADVAHFQQAMEAAGIVCQVSVIPEADHIYFLYVWSAEVIRQTVEWAGKTL